MTIQNSRHLTLTFEESVEDYRQRLLNAEMELCEMLENKQISKVKFRTRMTHIKILNHTLDDIFAEWNSVNPNRFSEVKFKIPNLSSCNLDEQNIVKKALIQRFNTLKSLEKTSNKLIKTILKTLSGKGSMLTITFYLSKLRTNLTKLDAQIHSIDRFSKKIDDFTNTLSKHKTTSQLRILSKIDLYRDFFNDTKKRNEEIRTLKITAHKEKQRAVWMERWLSFQEVKLENYNMPHAVPSLDSITNLYKKLNQNNLEENRKNKSRQTLSRDKKNVDAFRKNLRKSFKQRVKGENFESI